MTINFKSFFKTIADGNSPREWQDLFAGENICQNRFVPIGTGLGKTLGLAGSWFYHRVVEGRNDWPRRLVWCLPMRVLVEQTLDEFAKLCDAFRNSQVDGGLRQRTPSVHAFLGGVEPGATHDQAGFDQWHLYPENNAMIVGTQDMLLSRALGRGYAAGRARWPIDFGLLNSDCLWVFDEVQLMGVSAVTGSQLQSFRQLEIEVSPPKMLRPSFSWWSSATLRAKWLTTVDSIEVIRKATDQRASVPDRDKQIPTYAASKPVSVQVIPTKYQDAAKPIAEAAIEMHGTPSPSNSCVTLVVVNTVKLATEVAKQLGKQLAKDSTIDVRLIHSRFRGRERESWRGSEATGEGFLTKAACLANATNRIIVSTQVVEAGVDISAGSSDGTQGGLVTELAPWSSLVQRFGRAARYGGNASVIVLDRQLTKTEAAPYDEAQLVAARVALSKLTNVGLSSLNEFDAALKQDLSFDEELFKFEYNHLLTKSDFNELFDNSLDVTGDDIDISRFIREDDESNVFVSWIESELDSAGVKWRPSNKFLPSRLDICPVGFLDVREWLFDSKKTEGFRKVRSPYAFVWDYENGQWNGVRRKEDILPGSMVLVDKGIGGYDTKLGFVGSSSTSSVVDGIALFEVNSSSVPASEHASQSQASESVSVTASEFQSIADHGLEVGDLAERLAASVGFPATIAKICKLAGLWHDFGKSHPAFQGNITTRPPELKNARDLAKAPSYAWRHYANRYFNHPELSLPELYKNAPLGRRRGFRHELASVLGIFELLARADSRHVALRGNDTTMDELFARPKFEGSPDEAVVAPFKQLSSDEFNLLAYLIASHHGKVRCQLLMTEFDQDFRSPLEQIPSTRLSHVALQDQVTLPVRGVRTGDVLPAIDICIEGVKRQVPNVTLFTSLAEMGWNERYGASWSERTLHVQTNYGPFDLSLLEVIVRASDVRCSQRLGVDIAFSQVPEIPNSNDVPARESSDVDVPVVLSDDLEADEFEVLQ